MRRALANLMGPRLFEKLKLCSVVSFSVTSLLITEKSGLFFSLLFRFDEVKFKKWGLGNSGSRCISICRIYSHPTVNQAFVSLPARYLLF